MNIGGSQKTLSKEELSEFLSADIRNRELEAQRIIKQGEALKSNISVLEVELKSKQDLLVSIKDELAKLEEKKGQEDSSAEVRLGELRHEEELLKTSLLNFQNQILQLKSTLEDLNVDIDQLTSQKGELTELLSKSSTELRTTVSAKTRLLQEIEELEMLKKRSSDELDKLPHLIDETKKKVDLEIGRMSDLVSEKQVEHDQLVARCIELEKEVGQLEKKLKDLEEQIKLKARELEEGHLKFLEGHDQKVKELEAQRSRVAERETIVSGAELAYKEKKVALDGIRTEVIKVLSSIISDEATPEEVRNRFKELLFRAQ